MTLRIFRRPDGLPYQWVAVLELTCDSHTPSVVKEWATGLYTTDRKAAEDEGWKITATGRVLCPACSGKTPKVGTLI